jgi:hypothetical protein
MAGALGVLRYECDYTVDDENISIFACNGVAIAYT